MRASRQTELQCEFPLHVVCSWLGNSPRIAQQSYLLVIEDDFAKAAGVPLPSFSRSIHAGLISAGMTAQFIFGESYGFIVDVQSGFGTQTHKFSECEQITQLKSKRVTEHFAAIF